jgi:hypothetical protein
MEGREMAYNPTTWGSNDVITKDRLNKMEQGIVSASKLSGTDIDTDKDWNGKNITNAGTVSATTVTGGTVSGSTVTGELRAKKVISLAGDTTVKSGTEVSGSSWPSSTPLPLLTATVPASLQPGSKIRCTYTDPHAWNRGIRVLVNDVEVYISSSVHSADVDVTGGDVVEVQMYPGATNTNMYQFTGQIKVGGYIAVVDPVTPAW